MMRQNQSLSRLYKQRKSTKSSLSRLLFPKILKEVLLFGIGLLYLILDEVGEVEMLIFNLHDVTEQKSSEIELERLIESSYDLLCVIGYDLVVRRVNQAFKCVLGIQRVKLLVRLFLITFTQKIWTFY